MDFAIAERPRSPRRSLAIAAAIAGALALAWIVTSSDWRMPSVERSGLQIDVVRTGRLPLEVRGAGTLVPDVQRLITAQSSARVERVVAHNGESLPAGTLLLKLSNPDLEIQTMQAERLVHQARSEMLSLKTQLEGQLLTQEAAVASARASLFLAQQEAAAAESLVVARLVPLNDARAKRTLAREWEVRMQVEERRLALLTTAKDAQLAAQVEQVDELRRLASHQRARAAALDVVVPDAGVVQGLQLQPGQWVAEGTTLARVIQPKSLKAVVRIPETQAKDIALGQFASVDTRLGVVRGRVVRRDQSSTGGFVAIDIAFEDTLPSGVVPDMSVQAIIELDAIQNVTFASRPAGAPSAGPFRLFKIEEGGRTAVRQQVVLGRGSVTLVEVVRGLIRGDSIVVSDMSAFEGATRVRLK